MPKAEREHENAPPLIDIPSVLSSVINGNEDATRQLDEALRQRLMPYFMRRNPVQAEDLIQETIIRIDNSLPNFNPNIVEGAYTDNFWGWVFTIGRHCLIDQYRKNNRITETFLQENIEHPLPEEKEDSRLDIDDQAVLNVIKDKFPDLLTKTQLRSIDLKMQGNNSAEIARIIGLTVGSAKVTITKARKKIEREILGPAGFKRIKTIQDESLKIAARRGRLKAIKILGRYYAREEDIKAYRKRSLSDPYLINLGYILLSSSSTSREYNSLSRGLKILRRDGRLYIKKEDLEEFRKQPKNKKSTFSPTPLHKRVSELCSSLITYHRTHRAIRESKLKAVKYRGVSFVTQEDFDAWKSSEQKRNKTQS